MRDNTILFSSDSTEKPVDEAQDYPLNFSQPIDVTQDVKTLEDLAKAKPAFSAEVEKLEKDERKILKDVKTAERFAILSLERFRRAEKYYEEVTESEKKDAEKIFNEALESAQKDREILNGLIIELENIKKAKGSALIKNLVEKEEAARLKFEQCKEQLRAIKSGPKTSDEILQQAEKELNDSEIDFRKSISQRKVHAAEIYSEEISRLNRLKFFKTKEAKEGKTKELKEIDEEIIRTRNLMRSFSNASSVRIKTRNIPGIEFDYSINNESPIVSILLKTQKDIKEIPQEEVTESKKTISEIKTHELRSYDVNLTYGSEPINFKYVKEEKSVDGESFVIVKKVFEGKKFSFSTTNFDIQEELDGQFKGLKSDNLFRKTIMDILKDVVKSYNASSTTQLNEIDLAKFVLLAINNDGITNTKNVDKFVHEFDKVFTADPDAVSKIKATKIISQNFQNACVKNGLFCEHEDDGKSKTFCGLRIKNLDPTFAWQILYEKEDATLESSQNEFKEICARILGKDPKKFEMSDAKQLFEVKPKEAPKKPTGESLKSGKQTQKGHNN